MRPCRVATLTSNRRTSTGGPQATLVFACGIEHCCGKGAAAPSHTGFPRERLRNRASHVRRDRVIGRAHGLHVETALLAKGPEEIDALTGARRDSSLPPQRARWRALRARCPATTSSTSPRRPTDELDDAVRRALDGREGGEGQAPLRPLVLSAGRERLVFEAGTAKSAGVEIVDGLVRGAVTAARRRRSSRRSSRTRSTTATPRRTRTTTTTTTTRTRRTRTKTTTRMTTTTTRTRTKKTTRTEAQRDA